MNTLLRKAAIAAMSGALVIGTATTGAAASAPDAEADEAITCLSTLSAEDAFYDGESASYVYDEKFGPGPTIPGLTTHTPQGVAAWKNWDGNGEDLLLVTSYQDGKDAHLIGIDPKSGKHIGTVAIAESHVGGIAVSKGWAFVQGRDSDDWDTIRKYKLSELKTKMKQEGVPYLKQEGTARNVYGASFLSSYGDNLYAGKFNDRDRDKMYRYKVGDDGSLETQQSYEVPMKTQGLMVTKDHFIYSTSLGNDNRSNIYIVDRGATDIDRDSTWCFRAPSMAEGIAQHDGNAYLVFESGSDKYVAENPRNVIKRMHKVKTATLTSRPTLNCKHSVGNTGGWVECQGRGTWRVKSICNNEPDKYTGWRSQRGGTHRMYAEECTFDIDDVQLELR